MSGLIALSLVLSGLVTVAPAQQGPLPFLTDLDAALALSGYESRPIYLHLSASWCEPCKTLRDEIYPAPAIQERLRRFIRVDLDVESARGKRAWMDYNVSALPTALVIREDGASLDRFRVTGVLEVDALAKLLDEALVATSAPQAAKRDRDPQIPEPEGRPAQERWGNYLWFVGCGLLTASLWMKFKQRYPKEPES
jgi:thiol-disulfide isomerase/thioredoxin